MFRTFTMVVLGLLVTAGAATAQDWRAQPTFGTVNLSAGFTPDPHVVTISAGGGDAVSLSGAECTGYINESAPDVDLNYDAGMSGLYIYAVGEGDLTLVINAPDGTWHCSDDWSGTDPMVHFPDPDSGNYNIWVGTFSDTGLTPAEVRITELRPDGDDGSSSSAMPSLGATPVFGSVSLASGFTPDPRTWSIRAGGEDTNPIDGDGCAGYINSAAPDLNLSFTAGTLPLHIYADASSDVTLLVNDPSGDWYCSDDQSGTDPGLKFAKPLSGTYNIWVGTFRSGSLQDATLYISERGFMR